MELKRDAVNYIIEFIYSGEVNILGKRSSVLDPLHFPGNPDPGSALEKNPDPNY